mmetsp:Transcript_38065/g.96236  ORF Transcript_38065/g.96236 Transcript_38065/m.96236 type:complete len:203 (+) Transcript_38065:323-931(+)
MAVSVSWLSASVKALMFSLSCSMVVEPMMTEPMYQRPAAQACASCASVTPADCAMAAYFAAASSTWGVWYLPWKLGNLTWRAAGGGPPGVRYLSVSAPPASTPYASRLMLWWLGAHASASSSSKWRQHSEKSFWMVMGGGTPSRLAASTNWHTPNVVSLLSPQWRTLPSLISSPTAATVSSMVGPPLRSLSTRYWRSPHSGA